MRRLWVQLDAGRPSECTPHPTPADPSLPPPADPSHLLCLPPSPGLRPGRLSYLQGGELSADPWWSERRCLQASSPAPVPEPPPASHPCWQAPFPKPAHNPPLPFPGAHPPLRPLCLTASQETHMAGVASSGARIRVPSFSRWQNSSLICTPGYGEAPDGGTGWGLGGEQATAVQLRSEPPLPRPLMAGAHPAAPLPSDEFFVWLRGWWHPLVTTAMSIRAFTGTLAEALPILGPSGSVELC